MIGSHNMAISSLFGRPSTAVQQLMQTQIAQAAQYGCARVQEIANAAQARFNDIHYGATARVVQSMRAQNEQYFQSDALVPKTDIDSIQQVTGLMQRVVMATPDVRQMFLDGDIHGYGDAYVDHANVIGRQHRDYRNFTNGLVQQVKDEDTGETTTCCTVYFEAVPLSNYSIFDRSTFKQTMEAARHLIENSLYDPTSPDNELM